MISPPDLQAGIMNFCIACCRSYSREKIKGYKFFNVVYSFQLFNNGTETCSIMNTDTGPVRGLRNINNQVICKVFLFPESIKTK